MLLCALITEVSMSMGWYLIPLSSSVSSKEPTTYRASCLSAIQHTDFNTSTSTGHSHSYVLIPDLLRCSQCFLGERGYNASSSIWREFKSSSSTSAYDSKQLKPQWKEFLRHSVLSFLSCNVTSVYKPKQNPPLKCLFVPLFLPENFSSLSSTTTFPIPKFNFFFPF